MNIKKISGTLAVAVSVLVLSGPVVADDQAAPLNCDALISDIESLARYLRCAEWPTDPEQPGTWNIGPGPESVVKNNPIWKKKRDAVLGCEVHESLAMQLHFVRDPNGDKPPIKRGGNSKGGAANDLRNGKVSSAMNHLLNFSETIRAATPAKLNPTFDPTSTTSFKSAEDAAEYFVHEAEEHLLPYVNLCSK